MRLLALELLNQKKRIWTPKQRIRPLGKVQMTVVLPLLALSALIGFGLGTWFRWPAIVASSVGIAVFWSAVLQIQSFGPLPGIAIVVACLTVSQMAYLAASLRPGRLFQEQAHKEPRQGRNEDVGYEEQQQQRPPSARVS